MPRQETNYLKVNKVPEPYNPDLEFSCTPEEYDAGEKESYTPNAYRTMVRHECTNYDSLRKDLNRDGFAGRVYYRAIRDRIDELVAELIGDDWSLSGL